MSAMAFCISVRVLSCDRLVNESADRLDMSLESSISLCSDAGRPVGTTVSRLLFNHN